ncbi:hypothetical protein PGT21_024661 [Puccinia graminis f. sp. tritici]|uniref:Ribosomal RNA-processing protein 43 n=1 Tax=Puccinia graminis f. sp. tritici TaxID=56615 RepID=A0A5B0MCI9_PUCGR|nr:hypothetical protein PGT21_024661 [Puccinia graminis f. sp. tritici]
MNNPFEVEQLKRLQPSQFIKTCLANKLRTDGRTLHQSRPIHSHSDVISSAHASTIVSIGNTSVLCAIKFETAQPESAKPNQGFLVPNVELGPMCCPKYKPGPPPDQAQILATKLKDILISSGFVPLDSLVIAPGKLVWVVYIDIVCLSNDGNLFDASLSATTSALKSARIPVVSFDHETQSLKLANPTHAECVPLAIRTSISGYTFALYDRSTILPDPCLFEEDSAAGSVTLVVDDDSRNLVHLSFAAPAPSPDSDSPSPLSCPAVLDACFKIIHANPRPSRRA